MSRAVRLAHWLRRTREVGAAGVVRRVVEPFHAAAGARARRRWRDEFEEPLQEAALVLHLDVPALQRAAGRAARGADDALELAREHLGRGRFFLDPRDAALRESFGARFPAALEALIGQARAGLAGDLSWVVPGARSDWHAASPWGGRWPTIPSGEIEIGASAPLGDVRLSWEVGRCTHLVRWAQAAWLTRDSVFAQAVMDGMRSFAAANPPGLGIAWAHAQEAGLRAIAWLWAWHLVRDSGRLGPEDFRRWLGTILAHGEFVAAHLSDHVITHNHLVSEAAALMVLGLALPELRPAAGWAATGARVLFREIRKQVDEDGVQAELSTHYHAFVLDSYLAALILAERLHRPVPSHVRGQISRMAQFLALLLRPDGTLPPIGDTDAGRAWRLGLDPLDRRDLLAAAAVVFERGDWGAIAGDAPGAFWLTGGCPVPGAGHRLPRGLARCFPAAGIAVARSGFDPEAEVVVFRAGPTSFRRDVHLSHAHADALSALWRVGEHDVLLDPGVFLYSEGEGWRPWMRRTCAHSAPLLDDADQADVTSLRFGVAGLRPARWISCQGDGDGLAAEAEHPVRSSPRVRRRLAWLRGGILALCDDFVGDGMHQVDLWFQLPPSEGEPEGGTVHLCLEGKLALSLQCFGEIARIELHRPRPEDGPGPGWISPRYGVRRPATGLRVALGRPALPVRVVTLLQVAAEPSLIHPGRADPLSDGSIVVHVAGRRIRFPAHTGVEVEAAA